MPDTVTVRDSEGRTFDVPAADLGGYTSQGFTPETTDQRIGRLGADVQHDIYGGIGGKIQAAGAGALSGLTLGLSDVGLGALGAGHALRALQEEHPYISTGANVAGALGGALLTGGESLGARILAKSPAGLTSGLGRAVTGIGEGAGVLGRAGAATTGAAAEGALYGGGQYLSQVAIEDKPLSAEGFVGAMGTGALFAAPIGGALSLGESALLRARSLFPQQQVTREAARVVQQEATSAIGQSVADGEQMAQAIQQKIALTEAQTGMAQTGENVTRRVFGTADPQALGDQVTGAVERQQLTDALQRYQTSKVQLDAWVQAGGDPELEAALLGVTAPEVGQIGGRIEKLPGKFGEPELAAGTPVAPANRELADALDARSRQIDVTKVGKRPANDVGVPGDLIKGVEAAGTASDVGASSIVPEPPVAEVAKAAESAPVRIRAQRQVATQQSDALVAGIRSEHHQLSDAIDGYRPIAEKQKYHMRNRAEGMCDTATREFIAQSKVPGLKSHRFNVFSDEGAAEIQKLYHMTDEQMAAVRKIYKYRMKELGVPEEDFYHEVAVTPDGTAIDWTANQFNRLPVPYVYKMPAAAASDLESQLAAMKGKLDSGASLGKLSAESPARADYVSQKLAKREADAQYFRAKATGSDTNDFFANLTRPKTRDAYVAQNIGRAMREEGSHAAALAKVEREWTALAPPPPAPKVGGLEDLRALIEGMPRNPDTTSVLGRRILAQAGEGLPVTPEQYSIRASLGKRVGKNVDMGAHLERAAKVIGEHEAAIADMAEALGADAPATAQATAKAYRAAVADQADASASSTARAAQDYANKVAPVYATGGATLVDDAATKALRAHESKLGTAATAVAPRPAGDATVVDSDIIKAMRRHESSSDAAANRAVISLQRRATREAAAAQSTPIADTGSTLGKLANVGSALEVLKALGVHVPALSAIPVIGPVLGLYLKAKAVMGIIGRRGGSIGRSTEGIVAMKSAETRNRINAATTELLEGGARGLKKASFAAGPAALLATSLFPGGDDSKSKDPQALYVARMDELARAQAPGAIAHAISDRVQTSDPRLLDAITAQVERGLKFLDSKAPKQTVMPGMLPGDGNWKPSKAALEEWGKYVHAVNDPASVLEDLAKGHVTMEGAETLRIVYPLLYAEAQRTLMEAAPKMQKTLTYARRVAISIMYQVPIDATMTPEHLMFLQPPQPTPIAPGPAMPSPGGPAITGPLQLGQQTMPPLDKRAGA